jgi:outer membrane lipoprotein SlyB
MVVWMPFVFYSQGVSSFYGDFLERLMSELALRGTEITNEKIGDEMSQMNVKYIDERGNMIIGVDNKNIKTVYNVSREKQEVSKGLMGALSGAGIGSLLGGALRGGGNLKDRVIDAASGAVAGGVYEAFQGYEDSKEERTAFAQVLAEAMNKVEDDLQYIVSGQEAAREERSRAKSEEVRELERELDEVLADAISLGEEVELAELEGLDVKRSKIRVERAKKLYEEAMESLKSDNYSMVRAKIKSARDMIDRARGLLEI